MTTPSDPFTGGSGAASSLAVNMQRDIDTFTRSLDKLSAVAARMGGKGAQAGLQSGDAGNTFADGSSTFPPMVNPFVATSGGSGSGATGGASGGPFGALPNGGQGGGGAGRGLPSGMSGASMALSAGGAIVGALGNAGSSAQPNQLALNTLQYQSALYGQSPQVTGSSALGTAGTAGGSGQQKNYMSLNPIDAAQGYSTLQATSLNANPYSSRFGGSNVMGGMGGVSAANPSASEASNASVMQQIYSPQTSMNMMMMGYPVTPRQAGTGNAQSITSVTDPLLNRMGNGKPMTNAQLMTQLQPGQKGNASLTALFPGMTPDQLNQTSNLLLTQNALMTGGTGDQTGKQKDMSASQVNTVFGDLASTNPKTQASGQAILDQYGFSQSQALSAKNAAGTSAQTTNDTSQGYTAGIDQSNRLYSDMTGLVHSWANALGVSGPLGAVTGFLGNGSGGGATNAIGGGSATMYDSVEPDAVPKTLLPGTSGPLMVAYYPTEQQPTKSKFPSGTQFVSIDNSGSHTDADVVDMEAGAVFPASAVTAWLKKAGGTKVVYATASNKASLDAVKPPNYLWWEAAWNGSQTVPAGAVAHQFANHPSYDASVVSNPGAFNGKGGGASPAAATPAAGTSTTTTTSGGGGGVGGLGAGLGDYTTEGSTSELSAFEAAIMGGGLGGGGRTSTTTTTAAAPTGSSPAAAPAATGGKTMYDTQYPSIVPKSADLVVSYVDGPQASNYNQAKSLFGSRALSITWTGENADIADVEGSAVSTSQLPAWIDAQHARGIPKPVVYAIYSGVGTNYQQVKQAVGTKSVSFWLSDWTGKPHTLPGADAVQYGAQASPSSPMITDPGKAGGHTYDLSAVAPAFPYYGGAPTLKPPAGHSGQAVPQFSSASYTYSGAHALYSGGNHSGITIHFPAGSITADDPAAAATKAVAQLKAELVKLKLVSN